MTLVDLPGIVTAADLRQTADAIVEWQLPSGMIPWIPAGHADPWNHVAATMALTLAGHHGAAERAFEWLAHKQRSDGAWHQYYLADRVEQDKLDANVCAFVATGVWHRWLCTRDRAFVESAWSMVEKAIDFVLDLQTPRGEILWARNADGTPRSFALLAGSSSVWHSLRCAIALADLLSHERPDWELSALRLRDAIRHHEVDAFAPKRRWALDWYYPVLTGVVTGDDGRARLMARHDAFVMEGRGVRCVADRPWVTVAETCEYAMASQAVDLDEQAQTTFAWVQQFRSGDGRYWTGTVYPDGGRFPADERSTYTATAVVLAADALSGASPASGLFTRPDIALTTLLPTDETRPGLGRTALNLGCEN